MEKVNIADWILHLPDAEYQCYAEAHIAAGATTTDGSEPRMYTIKRKLPSSRKVSNGGRYRLQIPTEEEQ